MSTTQSPAPTGSVTSADGTTIGYRRVGDGPGVVLLHGAGQSSQNLMTWPGLWVTPSLSMSLTGAAAA
jgi:pimeloyl-ACP methyl ester carboxylesterase